MPVAGGTVPILNPKQRNPRRRQSRIRIPESGFHWLRLVRWKNLLIVAGTQALAWACVIWPLRGQRALVLLPGTFACLMLSTVCIAAAGYLINDYFDIKIDAINRPQKSILENPVHRRRAIIAHGVLSGVGLILAAIVAFRAGRPLGVLWQAGTVVLLWFYSTHFKRMFLVGNVVVAFLTGLTVALLPLFEPAVQADTGSGPDSPFAILAGFAAFAFLLTWMREIVKDAEDLKGDAAEGCDTMPIRWGLLQAMRFTQGIGGVALAALSLAATVLLRTGLWLAGTWLVIALAVPLLVWLLQLPRLATTPHYARASRRLKLLMLAGLFTLVLLRLNAF